MNISIIVPVYNAETFLIKCLDSIFAQKFSGTFEVIAIDDASLDESLLILKKYQEKEVRLRIIEHAYNKKQAVARATGMREAKGDYIMHVDSDDWLLPGALERLYNIWIEFNPDVIVFNYVSEYTNGKRHANELIRDEVLTTDKISIQKYFYGNSATKFVRKSLTENMITGAEITNSTTDDLLYCTEILLRAESFYLLPETYYVAYINDKSFTRTVNALFAFQSKALIIKLLNKITIENDAETIIINNILIYFEDYFFRYSLPLWLSGHAENKSNVNDVINSLKVFPEMTDERLNQLNKVFKKSNYAFYYAYKNYGLLETIRIVLGALYNEVKVRFINKQV